MKGILAVITLAVLVGGCASEVVDKTAAAPSESAPTDKFAKYPLGVCETKGVKFAETQPAGDELSQSEIESKIVEGSVRVLHGDVTVSSQVFKPPTDTSIFTSANGKRLKDFPAWIVVQEGIRMRGGGPGRTSEGPVDGVKARYITAWAEVFDPHSGDGLFGWSCGAREEYADGTVVESRGVDPDLTEETVTPSK